MTQQELDYYLDKRRIIPVEVDTRAPIPSNKTQYNPIRNLSQTGFDFTVRELLHAIGSKTTALPKSKVDECLCSAYLYTQILDLTSTDLCYKHTLFGSDLLTVRSQEIGIGFMSLIADKYFNIPWDTLSYIPGQGKRFDYIGNTTISNCIFEAKGTSSRSTQPSQITSGIEKKDEIHNSGNFFDIELIVSTCIGNRGERPRILIADPNMSVYKELFIKADNNFRKMKHYAKVLNYIGMSDISYDLNLNANRYLNTKEYPKLNESLLIESLQEIQIGNERYIGKWYAKWLPENKSGKKLYDILKIEELKIRVFIGLNIKIYNAIINNEFLETDLTKTIYNPQLDNKCVFKDGTVLLINIE